MEVLNKKSIIAIILVLILLAFSSTVYAQTAGGAFGGGLKQINDFFENEGYKPYSKAIDFFFFSLLLTAIYMMGARYAFKEIKRPELLIVILLGLMTAFLLVLGGFSATILLPYIHYLLYLLLFILWWWLLKGIKNKFWRFILALLLTLLTIALLRGLFVGITAPETDIFASIADAFKGIEIPGVQAPGVPDYFKDLLGAPTAVPTGPEPLPSVPTPTLKPKERTFWGSVGDFLSNWWWLLVLLALAGGSTLLLRRRRGPTPQPQPPTPQPTPPAPTPPTEERTIAEIITKIDEINTKKRNSGKKIIQIILRDKAELMKQGDTKTGYVAKLIATAEEDIANLFLDKSRNLEELEEGNIKKIIKSEREFLQELERLNETEQELYKRLVSWETVILQNISEDQKVPTRSILYILKVLMDQNIQQKAEDAQKGILWLIAYCYNLEAKQNILLKELGNLFAPDPDHIKDLVKGKFKVAIRDVQTLEAYNLKEKRIIGLLSRRLLKQIEALERLKILLRTAHTPPSIPPPTNHPPWPGPQDDKHDPTPPEEPVFPIEPVIPPPPKPKPTRHKDLYIDLSSKFLPIKNQQNTGSCAAFAGTSIIECFLNRSVNDIKFEHELSELFLWYNIRPDKNSNMGVYNIVSVPNSLRELGVCFEPIWSWKPVGTNHVPIKFANKPIDQAYKDAFMKRIIRFGYIPPDDPDIWVDLLKKGYPIFIGIEVDDGFIRAGRERKNFYGARSGQGGRYHCVVIVGFTTNFPDQNDPSKGIAAFKIRNSWGRDWGENGYIWTPYDLLPTILCDVPYIFEGLKKEEITEETKGIFVTITKPKNYTKGMKPFYIDENIEFNAVIANLEISKEKGYAYGWSKINPSNRIIEQTLKEGRAYTNKLKDTIPASVLGLGEHVIVLGLFNVFPQNSPPKNSLFSGPITINVQRRALKKGKEPKQLTAGILQLSVTLDVWAPKEAKEPNIGADIGTSIIFSFYLNNGRSPFKAIIYSDEHSPIEKRYASLTQGSQDLAFKTPGKHTVTVLLEDSEGKIGTNSINVYIKGRRRETQTIQPMHYSPKIEKKEEFQITNQILTLTPNKSEILPNSPIKIIGNYHISDYNEFLIGKSQDCEIVLEDSKISYDHQIAIRFFAEERKFGILISPYSLVEINSVQKKEWSWLNHGDKININGYNFDLAINPKPSEDEILSEEVYNRQFPIILRLESTYKSSTSTNLKQLEDIGYKIISEVEKLGRGKSLALLSNLRQWLETNYKSVRAEPLSEQFIDKYDTWLIIVLTTDGLKGVAVPTVDSSIGPSGHLYRYFNITDYDGTQPLLARDIKRFAKVGYDYETGLWVPIEKGEILLQRRH